MTDTTGAPWRTPGYSDVRVVERVGDDLHVEFANGDVVRVSPTRFGVEGDFEVRFDDESPTIELVTPTVVRDVSWAQIRSATDPEFAQEMRRQDAEESRRIGRRLRALREDRGLSQRDVAGLVGMTAPQLSKIESGNFDLRVSTVQTLLRAMGATFAEIAGPDALEISQKSLRRSAERAGVSPELVDRLLSHTPRHLVRRIFAKAFGWDLTSADFVPHRPDELGVNVLFKSTGSTGEPVSSSPLVRLAVACSEAVLITTERLGFSGLPPAPEARAGATDSEGLVTLPSLTEWAWGRGVSVIPLQGRGAFCAAAWSINDSPVAIIKDSRSSAVFWLFDLAHELGHIALGHVHGHGIVDVDQLGPDETIVDAQEKAANDYALELLLGDHAGLVELVRRESRGNYLRFKGAVATIAKRSNVGAGLLGMVAAYELTDLGQPKDRWGSATNLAAPHGDGREQVEAALRRRLVMDHATDQDAALLSAAVLSG